MEIYTLTDEKRQRILSKLKYKQIKILSDLSKENEAALINRNMLFLGFMNNTIKQLSKM